MKHLQSYRADFKTITSGTMLSPTAGMFINYKIPTKIITETKSPTVCDGNFGYGYWSNCGNASVSDFVNYSLGIVDTGRPNAQGLWKGYNFNIPTNAVIKTVKVGLRMGSIQFLKRNGEYSLQIGTQFQGYGRIFGNDHKILGWPKVSESPVYDSTFQDVTGYFAATPGRPKC